MMRMLVCVFFFSLVSTFFGVGKRTGVCLKDGKRTGLTEEVEMKIGVRRGEQKAKERRRKGGRKRPRCEGLKKKKSVSGEDGKKKKEGQGQKFS